MTATEVLETRARRVRSRAAVRAWEYRQRRYSKGVWFRLRRLLAGAESCWMVDRAEAERLEREGFRPEPVGFELEPPRRVFMLSRERARSIERKRMVRVELSAELLSAEGIVLVPFPH